MISGKNKDLYYTSSIDKQLNIEVVGTKIVIDNSMRERDTFTLTESLNDGSELKFGSCLPNQISFIAHDMPAGLIGKTLRPVESLEGNENDPFTYGEYKILSAVPTADRTKRQVTAYDAMYDIINEDVKAWYDGLTFPMTLKAFRDSFFAYLGIEQEETSLVNDSMTVNKTLIASSSEDSSVTAEATISGKTIVEDICEINGAFGNMNRAGKFEYVILPSITSALYPADDLYPRDDLFPSDANTESMTGHYITFDYEDFQSKAITQLEIRADDNTAGAIVGNPGNTYVISGNFLVSDKTGAELEQIANNVFPIMAQAAYTPIKSCTTVGNPCLELGDPIRFNTSREIVETYLLQRTLTGVQSKRDSIVAQGTPTHTTKTNSIRETLESVQRRTSKLEQNADHLLAQFNDLGENTSSQLEMTASQIQAEVTARLNSETEMSTRISQSAHSIGLTASGGDQSVGLTIQLYDENGNVIDTSSDNANITVTGFVSFFDLANAGSTTINGANITTGIIKSSDSEFTRAKFYEGIYYGLNYNGTEYSYPLITIPTPGDVRWGDKVYMNTTINGSAVFNDPLKRVYLGSASTNNRVATMGDIPKSVSYATSAGSLAGQPSISVNRCYAEDFYFGSSPSAGSSLLPIGYNSSTYHFGHYTGSSERFKNSISDKITEQALDPHRLYDADIFQYKYNADYLSNMADCRYDKLVIGFIAENLEKVYPVAVDKDDYGTIMDWNYKYVIPPMLSLIQEQHKEIEQLKIENLTTRGEINILKQQLQRLEDLLC